MKCLRCVGSLEEGSLQDAQAEDGGEDDFVGLGDLQVPDHGKRKAEDHAIHD